MGDASLVEMSVVKVSPYLKIERPLLWLCERNAARPRLLPIAIGQFEAAAIQMQLDREEPLRPISYDLLASMLNHLAIPVRYVVIHTARKQIYHARIAVENRGQVREVDSRPSDAIALALRAGAPVYVSRELLELVGYVSAGGEGEIEQAIERFCELEPQIAIGKKAAVSRRTGEERPAKPGTAQVPVPQASQEDVLTQLQAKLEQAIICEAYEEAAKLRDEIEVLVNKTKA